MKKTQQQEDELFRVNNDHRYCNIPAPRPAPAHKRALAFKYGSKSKSLDTFDRPDVQRAPPPPPPPPPPPAPPPAPAPASNNRRELFRVKSLASIPEHSVQVR